MAPATEPAIRLLVVDDHLMVREGLRSMLSGDEIEIVGEASTGAEAVRAAADLSPEVVLLDLELPDMDGLTVLRQLKEIAPALPVLVVTMHDNPALVRRAVRAGAAGYVLKGIGRAELLASVRAVRNGESVLDPGLLRAVVDADGAPARTAPPLSRIELDLLRLVADGLTNREIGQRLRWSQATVKKYVQRILEKLDVSDRTQAAVEGMRAAVGERVPVIQVDRVGLHITRVDQVADRPDQALPLVFPFVAAAGRKQNHRRPPVAVNDDVHVPPEPIRIPPVLFTPHGRKYRC